MGVRNSGLQVDCTVVKCNIFIELSIYIQCTRWNILPSQLQYHSERRNFYPTLPLWYRCCYCHCRRRYHQLLLLLLSSSSVEGVIKLAVRKPHKKSNDEAHTLVMRMSQYYFIFVFQPCTEGELGPKQCREHVGAETTTQTERENDE